VIRPLVYVWEQEVIDYTRQSRFPVVCCCCSACGDSSLQRHQIKTFLRRWEEGHPGVKASLLRATRNVHHAYLMDPRFLPLAEAGPPLSRRRQLNPSGTPESGRDETAALPRDSARCAAGGAPARGRSRDAAPAHPLPADSRE